jgi:hypothetical protein
MILNVLSRHDKKVADLLQNAADEADINHPVFMQYKHEGQELLKQLVTA